MQNSKFLSNKQKRILFILGLYKKTTSMVLQLIGDRFDYFKVGVTKGLGGVAVEGGEVMALKERGGRGHRPSVVFYIYKM